MCKGVRSSAQCRGDKALVHWWYFPDSYDEIVGQDDAPEVIEPDKQPEGADSLFFCQLTFLVFLLRVEKPQDSLLVPLICLLSAGLNDLSVSSYRNRVSSLGGLAFPTI